MWHLLQHTRGGPGARVAPHGRFNSRNATILPEHHGARPSWEAVARRAVHIHSDGFPVASFGDSEWDAGSDGTRAESGTPCAPCHGRGACRGASLPRMWRSEPCPGAEVSDRHDAAVLVRRPASGRPNHA